MLNRVRIDALPAHGLIGENRSIGIGAVDPGIEISRPFLRVGFLQVGNGSWLYILVGNFQHPLLKTQPARLRLRLERSFFFWWQIECDSHNCSPYVFRLTQSPHIGGLGSAQWLNEAHAAHLVLVARRLGEDAAAGIAEVTRTVEFADVPGDFGAHAVDGADEIAVGDGVGGLLQLPQILAETGDGGRGVEDDLGAGQSQSARAFGELAVVADVDADFDEAEVEDGEAEVAGAEVELLPEAGRDVRDVGLAVLAEEAAVVVDDGGGVVVDACLLDFVDGHDEGNVILLRQILHEADGGSVGDGLGEIVPAGGLLGAEVGPVEDLLEADDLRAGPGGLLDISDVLIDHGLFGDLKRGVRRGGVGGLNQRTANDTSHENSLDRQG